MKKCLLSVFERLEIRGFFTADCILFKMEGPTESIYNLIPQPEENIPKLPRYTSKFKFNVKEEMKIHKSSSKSMGPAKLPPPAPENFLKKHSSDSKLLSISSKPSQRDQTKKKPPVPKHDEKPLMGIRSNKNFINTNAEESIMSVPRKPVPKYVDTRKGDSNMLERSGLVPKYISKTDYGQMPDYLKKRNEEVAQAQEEYDAYVRERMRQGAMKQLTDEERNEIIGGLKQNWEELHHQYQGLSVVTDTLPKKNRKERMEAEMKQLERDIELIEKHKVIYIGNN